MIKKLKKYLLRKKTKVFFDDNLRTTPACKSFGIERGTPIDRYYIEKFLNQNRESVKGVVLEIADDTYSRKFNSGVTDFEVLHATDDNHKATIIGDLTDISTLPEERVDCFICTQTFNFIYDVDKAVAGAVKMLKHQGVLLGTVSGISQISSYDMERWGDYWRFTDLSVKILLEKYFSTVEVQTFGNILAAKAFLDGIVVEDLPDSSLLDFVDPVYQLTIAFKAQK